LSQSRRAARRSQASKIRYRPPPPQEPHVGEAFPLPEGYKRIPTTLVSVNAIRIGIVRYFQFMAFPSLAAPALSLLQCVDKNSWRAVRPADKFLAGCKHSPHPLWRVGNRLRPEYGVRAAAEILLGSCCCSMKKPMMRWWRSNWAVILRSPK